MHAFITRYKSIGIITGSLLITAILSFIALPFLSRLYTVEGFGIYGLALSIISVVSTISSLRLDQAVLVADKSDKASLVVSGSLIAILISLLCFVVLLFFKDLYFCIAVAGGVFANSVFQIYYSYSFSEKKEINCGLLNIYRGLILVAAQLSMPFLIVHSELIYGIYIQSFFLIVLSLFAISRAIKNQKIDLKKTLNFKDFIFINGPHALINSFSHNMPYYFITFFLGHKAVGYYAVVERVLRLPINLLSQVIRQFFIRDFSGKNDLEIDRKKALKASWFMSLLSAPFFLSLLFIPQDLYIWLFGKQWTDIDKYFGLLALGYWAVFCNPPVSAFIIAKRKSEWLLKFQFVEIIVKVVLALLIYKMYGQDLLILVSISIALIIYNFLNILFVMKGSN